MIKKCSNCGASIDLDNDEFLTTSNGILCINCANDTSTEEYDCSDDECPQTNFSE